MPVMTQATEASIATKANLDGSNATGTWSGIKLASPQQVANLFGGAPLEISSETTLSYPLPSVVVANTNAGGFRLHFPAFDAAQCELGQSIIIINLGTDPANVVTPYNSAGSQFAGAVPAQYICLAQIKTIGPDGLNQTMIPFQNLNLDGLIYADTGTNGIWAKTGVNTAVARTITAGSTKVLVTNGDGVSGNPAIDIDPTQIVIAENNVTNLITDLNNILAQISDLQTGKQNASPSLDSIAGLPNDVGYIAKTNSGTGAAWSVRTFTSTDGTVAITNPTGVAGNTDFSVDPSMIVIPEENVTNLITDLNNIASQIGDLQTSKQNASPSLDSVAGLPNTIGLVAKINNGTGAAWATRLIISSDGSLGVTNPSGFAGDIDLSVSKGLTIIPLSAAFTLGAAHNGTVIWMANTTAATVTVPSTLTAGFNCKIIQMGTGQVTIAGSGVTLTSADNVFKTRTKGSDINLILDTATVGWVGGDLVP